MIKIEHSETFGWEAAFRGMRNPLNSWDKSDTDPNEFSFPGYAIELGPEDIGLAKRLGKAGTDHRKYMRMITVYFDCIAPLYWWKQFDTYKVGTVANSCSTMHKMMEKPLTKDDFSYEHLQFQNERVLEQIISNCNFYMNAYRIHKEKGDWSNEQLKEMWWQIIQILPESYNQRRTIMLNYEVLAKMYKSRKNHKLDEWNTFCAWIEKLPYSELITGN